MAFLLAIAAGFLVWHATRANQARLGIKSRRAQIQSLSRDVRSFAMRGTLVLILVVFLIAVALKL